MGQHTTRVAVLRLADGSTIVGTMAGRVTTVLDLGPSAAPALDLFLKKKNTHQQRFIFHFCFKKK